MGGKDREKKRLKQLKSFGPKVGVVKGKGKGKGEGEEENVL